MLRTNSTIQKQRLRTTQLVERRPTPSIVPRTVLRMIARIATFAVLKMPVTKAEATVMSGEKSVKSGRKLSPEVRVQPSLMSKPAVFARNEKLNRMPFSASPDLTA